MDNNRRGFIIQSSLLALGGILPTTVANKVGIGSIGSPFLVTLNSRLPYEMSKEKFEKVKRKYINKNKMDKLFSSFKDSNKILSCNSLFDGTNHKVTMVFANKATYYSWCYNVVSAGAINEYAMLKMKVTNVNKGCIISAKELKVGLVELVESIAPERFKLLHKTKSIKDLSDFQIEMKS